MTLGMSIGNRFARLYEVGHGRHSPYRAMEGLRGFAVALVFLVHYVTLLDPWLPGSGITKGFARVLQTIGHSGVDLFFVLSGFLIYGTLIEKEKPFLPYLRRRIERIYPTFLTVLAAYVVLAFVFPAESKFPDGTVSAAWYLIANILLLPGIFDIVPIITVAWSLSYEMFFYLAVPLLIALLRLRQWPSRFRSMLFALLMVGVILVNLHYNLHVRLAMFAVGMLLWEVLRSRPARVDTLGLIALLAGMLAIPLLEASNLPGPLKYAVVCASFFLLCLACLGNKGSAYRLFCWRPARWLGNMSYSYYLIHGLGLKALFTLLGVLMSPAGNRPELFWLLLPVFFGLTFILSTILFAAVERPLSIEAKPTLAERFAFLRRV